MKFLKSGVKAERAFVRQLFDEESDWGDIPLLKDGPTRRRFIKGAFGGVGALVGWLCLPETPTAVAEPVRERPVPGVTPKGVCDWELQMTPGGDLYRFEASLSGLEVEIDGQNLTTVSLVTTGPIEVVKA